MMTVLDNLKVRLRPIKLYDEEAEALLWELKAYADEIGLLYSDLGQMFRERFISTAQDRGLSEYESLFGPVRENESADDRRRKLLLRMNLGDGDFTLAGIRKALDSFGISYTISEYPETGRLSVNATSDHTQAQQAWISREAAKIIPAHIEFQLSFNTLTWDQWDALNRTFSEIDAKDQTWQQIDNRTY